jgi:hypothetical protein
MKKNIGALLLGAFLTLQGAIHAQDSATILSITQGTVKSSLAIAGYRNTSTNLGAWPLNTGGNSAISYENPQFQQNTLVAFGNGGSVELQLNTAFIPTSGEKDLGIFTAQALSGGSGSFFNGNMEGAILVSSDGQNWYNLAGQLIANPATYTGLTYSWNAPTVAYDYGTGATGWNAGEAILNATQLAALPIANFTTPMPDDSLFNNPVSTNAQRLAITTDTNAADYTEEFGTSGGGNWFDVSGSGLSSIDYVMLNGDANDPSTGGVRLTNVFVNSSAVLVPEPATIGFLAVSGFFLLARNRKRLRQKTVTEGDRGNAAASYQ